jgi:hypothetical protein
MRIRGVLIYALSGLKHIPNTMSNIKNRLSDIDDCCQGGDEPKKLSMILSEKSFREY